MTADALPILDPLRYVARGRPPTRTPKVKRRIVTSRCSVAGGIEYWVLRSGIAVKIPEWITNSDDILGRILWRKHTRFEAKVGPTRGGLRASARRDSC